MSRFLFLASRDLANPHAAGGDVTMYRVARALAEDGHDIRYICSRVPGLVREEHRDGIHILRLGNLFTTSLTFLTTAWPSTRRWADFIVEEVVGGLRVPYLSPWFANVPRVCFWYQRNGALFSAQYGRLLGRILAELERGIVRFYASAMILTCSEASKRDLIAMGLAPNRVLVFRPGIDEELRQLAQRPENGRERLLLAIGKVRRFKCLHHAIIVLSRLRDFGIDDAKLVIAGRTEDEGYRRSMLALAEDLGVSELVRIETDITEERKADLLGRARLLLITSPIEGFGLTAIEANLFGVPVVGTTGVPSDVVLDGQNGYRVPFGDTDAFAKVCQRLLNSEDEWRALSDNARDYGRNFTWNSTFNTVRAALSRLGPRGPDG